MTHVPKEQESNVAAAPGDIYYLSHPQIQDDCKSASNLSSDSKSVVNHGGEFLVVEQLLALAVHTHNDSKKYFALCQQLQKIRSEVQCLFHVAVKTTSSESILVEVCELSKPVIYSRYCRDSVDTYKIVNFKP